MDRFYSKTEPEPNSGCLLWTGCRNAKGYGRFRVRGETAGAHRVAWELERGLIPEGVHVLHRCDSPACVNVDHLWLGTNADNQRDMDAKKRRAVGEVLGQSKLTVEKVAEARRLCASGATITAAAKTLGVNRRTLSDAVNRRLWKHVTEGTDNGKRDMQVALAGRQRES